MSEDNSNAGESLTSEEHLQAAIDHLKQYQQETPEDVRADSYVIRAATEIGAAKAYTKAAREATEDDDE